MSENIYNFGCVNFIRMSTYAHMQYRRILFLVFVGGPNSLGTDVRIEICPI